MPDEFKDKISSDDKKTLEDAIAEAESTRTQKTRRARGCHRALGDMSIGAKLYQQQAEDKKAEEEADAKAKATDKKPGKMNPSKAKLRRRQSNDKSNIAL